MINIESIRFSNRTKADKLDLNRTHTLAGNCRASRTLKACFNLVNLYFFVNHSYPRLTTLGVPLTFSAVILCFVVARFRASPSVCVQGRGATLGGGGLRMQSTVFFFVAVPVAFVVFWCGGGVLLLRIFLLIFFTIPFLLLYSSSSLSSLSLPLSFPSSFCSPPHFSLLLFLLFL